MAIAEGQADVNRCPPGGAEGVARLAAIAKKPVQALDAECGAEGPRALAVIDETWCIGCTLCIKACPVDCIVGASKTMHTVINDLCTGCELCLPVCPVDCIAMQAVTPGRSGWQAWSRPQAVEARERYAFHLSRTQSEHSETDERLAGEAEEVTRALQAALQRSRTPR
jgi:electron transport complex protein RnfB